MGGLWCDGHFTAVLTGRSIIKCALRTPSSVRLISRHLKIFHFEKVIKNKMCGCKMKIKTRSNHLNCCNTLNRLKHVQTFIDGKNNTFDIQIALWNLEIRPRACICYQKVHNLAINQDVAAWMMLAKVIFAPRAENRLTPAAKVTFGESFFYDRLILPIRIRRRSDAIRLQHQEDEQIII